MTDTAAVGVPTSPATRATGAGTGTGLNDTGRNDTGRNDTGLDVVTGAFSYSGSAIAEQLLSIGRKVRTLTGHPERGGEDGAGIEVQPLDFDSPVSLAAHLTGATTLYNTYWVRFAHGRTTHETAVANSRTLFAAARRAGVQRIVHVSITHPSIESPYPYFRGKALVERALAESGVPFAAVRPAILFGRDGVLINNIGWLLRNLPVFAIGGDGQYRVRPIHVEDLARLCVGLGQGREDAVVDAVGPESPTFDELVHTIREAVASSSRVVHVPPAVLPPLSLVLGRLLHDVLLTREELRSMMDGLADTEGPATGGTAVSEWVKANGAQLGRTYANELKLHF
jgi:nucleoside-diphosphate-sugar epimerase